MEPLSPGGGRGVDDGARRGPRLAHAGRAHFTDTALGHTVSLTDHVDGVSPGLVVGLGIVLFVVPEPITSVIGTLVVAVGLLWLLASRVV